MKVVGLMSGTSGDGVDAALVEIRGRGRALRLRLLAHTALPYPPTFQRRIVAAGLNGSVSEICHLNAALGEVFARAVLKVIRMARVRHTAVELIGSHGQTVHHLPQGLVEPGLGRIRSTLQIAEPAIIAERTGITTVANFRSRDVAAGGEGAPLAPYAHYLLFSHPSRARLIVNLGGISNVTFVPRRGALKAVRAFDTGPANMLLDGIMQRTSHGRTRMDRGGRLALRGKVRPALLRRMMQHPFLRRRPPKSTGREDFGGTFLDRLLREAGRAGVSRDDLLATAVQFTADTVSGARRWLPGPVAEVFIAGGGVRNLAVMKAMQRMFAPVPVRPLDDLGWSSQALEAVAFAVFAYQTIHGECANVPSVTGARHPVILGQIVPGRPRHVLRLDK
ncbi:anhydro-N-acetylmuramic acid kinase [Nitrospira sp.]|nr:anhydro-N-acetylmuramic acid kinase [Nitrospira sp.]